MIIILIELLSNNFERYKIVTIIVSYLIQICLSEIVSVDMLLVWRQLVNDQRTLSGFGFLGMWSHGQVECLVLLRGRL